MWTMDSSYDEDLNDNAFFQVLQTDHNELFQKATNEGWLICVPRAGALPKYAFTHEDFFSHILIPSDELPESHFRTLNDKEVRLCNRVLTVENDISRPYSTHVLFEETFYTEDMMKYKILCIENPLERRAIAGQGSDGNILVANTLRDCIDLLWTESMGKEVLEKLDELIQEFLQSNPNLEYEPLQVQRDLVGVLYTQSLQVALRDSRLRDKTAENKHLLETVKVAVETYMHHGIYHKLIKGVSACTAYEDAYLNKVIRNLSDIQLRDLQIRADLYDTVPVAKKQLARIEGFSTVLGKLGCMKRTIGAISRQNSETNSSGTGSVVAADDLLPVLVFLIIKIGIPSWMAHLTFMKQFRFSSSTCAVDEFSFLITTLEAAIEHVKSGLLLGPSAPEAQYVYEQEEPESLFRPTMSLLEGQNSSVENISSFFDEVRQGNVDKVKEVLERNKDKPSEAKNVTPSMLCHPLCSCDKCESVLSKSMCDTTPTVHSCDDRGFTALHIACIFGRPKVVDLLVSRGANVNATDFRGSTPLHYAASRGHQNALLLLLHSHAEINVVDNDGNTPLHFASVNGHEGCVKALIYFAEHVGQILLINATNINGDSPLHHAARWGYEGIVQILLEYGAQVNIRNNRRLTPLDCAHSLHILKLLSSVTKTQVEPESDTSKNTSNEDSEFVVVNLSPNSCDTSSAVPVRFDFSDTNTSATKSKQIVKKEEGIHPKTTEEIKRVDKMLRAIIVGDVRLAFYYLGLDGTNSTLDLSTSEPIEAKSPTIELCHPLCICEKCKSVTGTETQTNGKLHLDVNVYNSEGSTALHIAAMHGRVDVIKGLLQNGCKLNIQNWSKGVTPLMLACQHQRLQAAKLLLDAGCDISIQDLYGNTALHHCSNTGRISLVELMLKYKPCLDIRNYEGNTPLDIAEEKLFLRVSRMLKEKMNTVSIR